MSVRMSSESLLEEERLPLNVSDSILWNGFWPEEKGKEKAD